MDIQKLTQAINELYAAARLAPLNAMQHEAVQRAAQVIAEQLKPLPPAEVPKAE